MYYHSFIRNKAVSFFFWGAIVLFSTFFSTYATLYDFKIQIEDRVPTVQQNRTIELKIQRLAGSTYETILKKTFENPQILGGDVSQFQIESLTEDMVPTAPSSSFLEKFGIEKIRYFFNLSQLGRVWVSSKGDILCCGQDEFSVRESKSLNIISSAKVVLNDINFKNLKVKSNALAIDGRTCVVREATFEVGENLVNYGAFYVTKLEVTAAETFNNEGKIKPIRERIPDVNIDSLGIVPEINLQNIRRVISSKGACMKTDGSLAIRVESVESNPQ